MSCPRLFFVSSVDLALCPVLVSRCADLLIGSKGFLFPFVVTSFTCW